ncbi:putative cation transporter [Sphaerisporangium siamense]|uniref:Cobalt-zinc-cadmium efflux system protein n=1 Tax=Sphaerisporangium siamense TaxID=795645 RepID=A0A7W7D3I4_9ACTN|nr:cation diffusion facilitator family transporter [Sphaerisporangium siamense]MBB4699451.1 cobalt-zinc-cadmium efflux system protein [Sphaerisporangium siamense]GII86862.1 putative cation transporter [Sphaerisporangium siamense]
MTGPARHHSDRHRHDEGHGHGHGRGHGHGHGHGHAVSADADRRYLIAALALLLLFMVGEVIAGLVARSLALISDAGHMLTDTASILFALVAMRLALRPPRGGFTYGLKRAEILSAQLNGATLLVLAGLFFYEAVRRLLAPPEVEGGLVLVTALVGIVVNLAATWLLSRADRSSINVEGAYQHILNDLFAFIATAVSGVVVMVTGFARGDAIATLVVAALMLKAGYGLVRDTSRIFLQAAPSGLVPAEMGARLASQPGVAEVHDLHVWELTSGYASVSAHVFAGPGSDCGALRRHLHEVLVAAYGITHTTLQVDPVPPGAGAGTCVDVFHCTDPHGPHYRSPRN